MCPPPPLLTPDPLGSTGIVAAEPFLRMAQEPQLAANSILLTCPSNPFSGVWATARRRSPLPLATALTAVVAELLPVLLANIPFELHQTFLANVACTHGSLAVLGAMVLVLAASLPVRWPHMPVDPRSVAGAAYYVAGSRALLQDAAGLATRPRAEAEQRIAGLGRRYFYGRVVDASGRTRMVVDSVDR